MEIGNLEDLYFCVLLKFEKISPDKKLCLGAAPRGHKLFSDPEMRSGFDLQI